MKSGISDDPTTWVVPDGLNNADSILDWWEELRQADDLLHEEVGPKEQQQVLLEMAGASGHRLGLLCQALRRLKTGERSKIIGRELGLSDGTMAELAARCGIQILKRGPHGAVPLPVRNRALQLRLDGAEARDVVAQIQEEFGVELKPMTIHQWVRRHRKAVA